jgi:hypothetical protein
LDGLAIADITNNEPNLEFPALGDFAVGASCRVDRRASVILVPAAYARSLSGGAGILIAGTEAIRFRDLARSDGRERSAFAGGVVAPIEAQAAALLRFPGTDAACALQCDLTTTLGGFWRV